MCSKGSIDKCTFKMSLQTVSTKTSKGTVEQMDEDHANEVPTKL